MKILKYTFEIPQLIVEDGELIEMGTTQETHTFTMRFKGIDLYEKLTGRPLLNDLTKTKDGDIDYSIIKDIAKASYIKIDGDSFHNNMVTADEFTKTQAFSKIGYDTEFMKQLIEMVSDCCLSEERNKSIKNQASKK